MNLRRYSFGLTTLTFILLLIGVYTKEVGADLTCGMRWPLCNGSFFGLFPANFASFIEWFHRLIALVVGIMILYFFYVTYKRLGSKNRVTKAVAVAVLLLPIQVILGALTVTKARLFSPETLRFIGAYISVAHYGIGVLLLWIREDVAY
ncbi:MAG: COX15/CtaA family protein [Halobacteriaceae archaeon]